MIQSNIKYPNKISYLKKDKQKVIEVETFGELVHYMRKYSMFKPKILNLELLPWGDVVCFVKKNYSLVVDVINKGISVYYDSNDVGMVFQYKWVDEFNEFKRSRVDVSGYNRQLPMNIELLIKDIQNDLLKD